MMRAIFTLAWPTVLEQALSTLVQYADTAQVGVLGAQASAAIGLTTTVMWLLYGPMGAAGMSVLSCISMSLGAGTKSGPGRRPPRGSSWPWRWGACSWCSP